jgi:hypothetical protein
MRAAEIMVFEQQPDGRISVLVEDIFAGCDRQKPFHPRILTLYGQ